MLKKALSTLNANKVDILKKGVIVLGTSVGLVVLGIFFIANKTMDMIKNDSFDIGTVEGTDPTQTNL